MELNVDEALRYLGIGGQAAESIRASVAAVADKLNGCYTAQIHLPRVFPSKNRGRIPAAGGRAGPSGRGRSENAGAVRSGRADGVYSGDTV